MSGTNEDGARPGSLRGLVVRVGELVATPRAAMARVEREGGGLNLALALVVAGTFAFRLPALVEALAGLAEPSLDAVMRIAGVFAREIQGAAWIVLPAAVLVTALAGARRDASRDLELGAACYAPYFAVTALTRAFELTAREGLPAHAGELAGAVATVAALVSAVSVARGRAPRTEVAAVEAAPPAGVAEPLPAAPRPPVAPGAVAVGIGVLAISVVGFAGNAAWSARHASTLRPILHGETAPDFRLPRADGKPGSLSLSELRGHVVVLDFWATWCGPCNAMMPTLHALDAEWRDRGVTFVGVNSDGGIDPAALQEFVLTHEIQYPVVLDEGDVGGLYKVRSLPTMIVIGKDGVVRRTFLGMTTKGSIARALEDAVAAR